MWKNFCSMILGIVSNSWEFFSLTVVYFDQTVTAVIKLHYIWVSLEWPNISLLDHSTQCIKLLNSCQQLEGLFSTSTGQTEPTDLSCRVPQWSVLGPVKFTAYTDDLHATINRFSICHHSFTGNTQQLVASVQLTDVNLARWNAVLPAFMIEVHNRDCNWILKKNSWSGL